MPSELSVFQELCSFAKQHWDLLAPESGNSIRCEYTTDGFIQLNIICWDKLEQICSILYKQNQVVADVIIDKLKELDPKTHINVIVFLMHPNGKTTRVVALSIDREHC